MGDPRTAYRQAAVQGASAVASVILLYEQMVEDLRRAILAIDQNDIETRTRTINHAILILGCLQTSLNLEAGGEAAVNLARFYELSRNELVNAQIAMSKPILNRQISDLLTLRDAWIQVERAGGDRSPSHAGSSDPGVAEERAHKVWTI